MNIPVSTGCEVLGLGCDLVDVARVLAVIERQGERFIERVFTPAEQAYCADKARPGPYWAARFAAKEAVSKCFGTGIGAELGWLSIEVVHGQNGEPLVRLDAQGQSLLARFGADRVLLSLSHTDTLAMAVATLVSAKHKNGLQC